LCSHTLMDGEKSKENAAIETLLSTNDNVPPPPLRIRLDGGATTEKMSRLNASTGVKSEQSDSSTVHLTAKQIVCSSQGPCVLKLDSTVGCSCHLQSVKEIRYSTFVGAPCIWAL